MMHVRPQAFVDEAEGFQSGHILLMAACIHTVSAWEKFTEDWQTVLNEPPSIRYFHTREARPLEGEFKGWKSIDRDLKIIALTEVILRYGPHVVCCWLNVDDYNRLLRPAAPYDLRHAYSHAFAGITETAAEYHAMMGGTVPMDYIFDDKQDIGNEAALWYAAIKEGAPEHVRALMGSTPVFRNDEEVIPLQAADLVAWHKRRRKEIEGIDTEVAASMRIDELRGAERGIPSEHFVDLARRLAAVPNVDLTLDGPSIYQQLKRAYRKTLRQNKAKGHDKPEK